MIDISIEEADESSLHDISQELSSITSSIEEFEFGRMFTNKMDPSAAYIEIQSGSGGTEAQDWAEMLLRMYTKWAENKNFAVEIIEVSHLSLIHI